MKRNSKKTAIHIASVALCLILIAAAIWISLPVKVNSVTSLKQIETIKNTSAVFTILEIVPQSGAGSIGYYIDGQEPVAGWKSMAAQYNSAAERETYVNDTLLKSLYLLGVIADPESSSELIESVNENYPLSLTGKYTEYLPWITPTDSDGSEIAVDTLSLENAEAVSVSGTFTYVGGGNGDFTAYNEITFVPDGSGSYVQNALYYAYDKDSPGEYYYSLTFKEAVLTDTDGNINASLFGIPLYRVDDSCEEISFKYEGTLTQGGSFTVDVTEDAEPYYVVSSVSAPIDTFPADPETDGEGRVTGGYYAVCDQNEPIILVPAGESGYFTSVITGYNYVGVGSGTHSYSPDGTDSQEVTYDTVKYSGGFTNNHWFLRYVFDMEEPEEAKFHIRVISLTPDQAEGITQQLTMANMIVLTAPAGDENKYTSDITDDQTAAIISAADDLLPLIVDSRLASCGQTNLASLGARYSGSTIPAVNGSVYCFTPDSTRLELITNQFRTVFSSDEVAADYQQVYDEIEYENFIRTNAGNSETLSKDISMGTCIRAIINRQERRYQNKKTSISVLDIEPDGIHASAGGQLTKAVVQSWLPDGTFTDDQINIVTMSTLEFVGKIENITEDYDMIYIGANLNGFNLDSNGETVYNDSDMNGLIYTNIGDTYATWGDYQLSGLLDRDYIDVSGVIKVNSVYGNLFRFSGNDITESKKDELENFALAGHPVIIADTLIGAGTDAVPESELNVTISASGSTTQITFTATLDRNDLRVYYQWYKNDAVISGANDATYVTDADDVVVGDMFRCDVTVPGDNGQQIAISNTLTASGQELSLVGSPQTASDTNITDIIFTLTQEDNEFSVFGNEDATYPYTYKYQWYTLSNRPGGTLAAINGEESNSYIVSSNNTYLCEITVQIGENTAIFYSQTVTRSTMGGRPGSTGTTNYSIQTNATYTSQETETVTATVSVDAAASTASKVTLVASATFANGYGSVNSYQWLKGGASIDGATGETYEAAETGEYSCNITYELVNGSSYTASSGAITVDNGYTTAFASADDGVGVIIPAKEATASSVNIETVDNCSYMYSALENMIKRSNVMMSSMAEKQQDIIVSYLNLSSPKINLEEYPTEYTGTDSLAQSLVTDSTLTFKFSISNETDPTPATTYYSANLYIDTNADGRYSDSELVSDPLIYCNGERVENGELQVNSTYTLSRTLSDNFSGAIPWRLKVEKCTTDGTDLTVSTSEVGYTYIKPSVMTEIKVLQVYDSDQVILEYLYDDSGNPIDDRTHTTYKTLYKELYDKGIYKIEVTSITISEFNNYTGIDQLSGYDMLITGFGDGYGFKSENIDKDSAEIIVDFIKSGRAVLFTHDNTSICNLNNNLYLVENLYDTSEPIYYTWTNSTKRIFEEGAYYWGYAFNSIVRDYVGLDRYGVTNWSHGLGVTSYGGMKTVSGIVASNDYLSLISSFPGSKTQLEENDYNIAYKPGSSKQATVAETQGFTNFSLVRFGHYEGNNPQYYPLAYSAKDTTGYNNRVTTTATQTNKGQITQYPYVIPETLTIDTSHEQYYQLNMNGDDIVVWYCLGGDNYVNTNNDVVNSYYIYNRGNVTYSGAGHLSGVTVGEAKLFVNTMIAAYRVGNSNPTVEFKDSEGADQSMIVVPVQYSGSEDDSSEIFLDSGPSLYFSVNDTNLTNDKTVTVEFYIESEDGTEDNELQSTEQNATAPKVKQISGLGSITDESGTLLPSDSSLANNRLYSIKFPSEVITALSEDGLDTTKMTVYIKVVTKIKGVDERYVGFSKLMIRKVGYLTLH